MDIELRDKERKAWAEVMKRLDFFLQAFRGLDVVAGRMSADKLGQTFRKYELLYTKRLTAEFGLATDQKFEKDQGL